MQVLIRRNVLPMCINTHTQKIPKLAFPAKGAAFAESATGTKCAFIPENGPRIEIEVVSEMASVWMNLHFRTK